MNPAVLIMIVPIVSPPCEGGYVSSASQSSGGEAIGTIVPRLNANFKSESEKKKYLYCDGSTFSASEYPKLALLIGTTLPDLRNRFLQGNDTGFNYIEAGLPNITGHVTGALDVWGDASGAFYKSGLGTGTGDSDDDNPFLYFDASRSNPIYGRSNTVQPPSLTVRYYIRAK